MIFALAVRDDAPLVILAVCTVGILLCCMEIVRVGIEEWKKR